MMKHSVMRLTAVDIAKIVVAAMIYAAVVALFARSVLGWID